MSDYDPARAKALLDLFGYVDRDGDGWRELPDGSPLVLEMHTQPEQRYRTFDEVWKKCMDAVGLRMRFITAQWPENLKSARAGKYQIWSLGGASSSPDSGGAFMRLDSGAIGGQNMARVRLPALDAAFRKLQELPDGPERLAVFRQAEQIAIAYMPYKFTLNRVSIDMAQPQVIGYRHPVFWQDWWHYVDIDPALRKAR